VPHRMRSRSVDAISSECAWVILQLLMYAAWQPEQYRWLGRSFGLEHLEQAIPTSLDVLYILVRRDSRAHVLESI
jgi:hypothetical protein